MACDLCGKSGPTKPVNVEGVVMNACSNCSSLGKPVLQRVVQSRPRKKVVEELFVVNDAGTQIKRAREKLGLSQEKLAQSLAIKESLLHSWESGNRTPTVDTAKQLEKRLHISLLEGPSEEPASYVQSSSAGLTIADIMKKK